MPAIEKLLRQLQSSEASERREAAMKLAGTDGRAIHPLIKALWDESPGVQEAAVNALASFEDEAVVWAVIPILREDAPRRNMALEILVRIGQAGVPILAERLGDKDPDVRKFVVDIFGLVGGADVVPPLRRALSDNNPNVRASAAKALGLQRAGEAVPELVSLLDDEEWVAFSAIEALGHIADEEAVNAITRLLDGPSPTLRMMATEALGDIRSPLASLALFKTLSRVEAEEKKLIAKSLVKIGISDTQELASVLVELLHGGSSEEQILAVEGLTTLRYRKAIPALVQAAGACDPGLPDDDELYRVITGAIMKIGDETSLIRLLSTGKLRYRAQVVAINALGSLGTRSAVEALVNCLKNGTREVRRAAARAQEHLSDEVSPEMLVESLRDEDGHVRRSVARALGRIGDPAALPALMELIRKESYPDVIEEAVEAASILDPGVLERLSRSRKNRVRLAVARLARGRELLRLVADRDLSVRVAAVLSLGHHPGARNSEALRALLKDPDAEVRKAAVRGLGALGDPEARKALLTCIGDQDMWVRMFAIDALGSLEETSALEGARAMLRDEAPPVRVAAIRYLERFGRRDDLLPFLEDPDEQVREEAGFSLSRMA